MRHRAPRPLSDFWHRLAGASAHRLGTAVRHGPIRAVGFLVVVVGLGAGGYLASVGGSSTPRTEPPGSAPADAATTSPTDQSSPSGSQSPEAVGSSPIDSPSAPDATPPTGRSPAPSPTGGPDSPLRSALGEVTGSPSVGAAAPSTGSSSEGSDPSPSLEDLTAPVTSLSEELPEGDVAVFSFSSDEAASFACSLDGARYAACGSPARYSDLTPGWHTFAVRATDDAGNVDRTPAQTRWLATDGHSDIS